MLPTGSTFVAMRKLCASNCGSRIKSMSGFFSARRLPPVEDNQTAVTPIIIEGRNIGQPLAKRTLSPFAQPMPIDATGLPGFPAQSIGGMAPHVAPSTNVSVNNNGQFYRPWREELALSFAKAVGNFFAWPFRLLGKLAEGILNAGLGIVKMMLIAVVAPTLRSEEHTSELQSLMRISYAVFCLKKK